MAEHVGKNLTIRYAEEGHEDNWINVISNVPRKSQDKLQAKFITLRDYLADGGQLRSPDQFRKEGQLPNSKYFYAIKAGDVRAYGWHSTKHKGVFYISHFIYKTTDKLTQTDTNRVCGNWRTIEEA